MSTATAKRKASTKTVQRIARFSSKIDPRKVVYLVRSSDGSETYETSFFNGKAVGCNCPAQKPCYHMIQLEKIEAARVVLIVPEVSTTAYEVGGLEDKESYIPSVGDRVVVPASDEYAGTHGIVSSEVYEEPYTKSDCVTVAIEGKGFVFGVTELIPEEEIDEDARYQRYRAFELQLCGGVY